LDTYLLDTYLLQSWLCILRAGQRIFLPAKLQGNGEIVPTRTQTAQDAI